MGWEDGSVSKEPVSCEDLSSHPQNPWEEESPSARWPIFLAYTVANSTWAGKRGQCLRFDIYTCVTASARALVHTERRKRDGERG